MGALRSTGAGGLFLGALAMFAVSIVCFFFARRETSIAPHESSTTAEVFRHYRSGGQTQDRYVCDYSFTVDGKTYRGTVCPLAGFDNSLKAQLLAEAGSNQTISATIYYDTNDPSTNSPFEFAANSQWSTRCAILSVCLGALLLGLAGVVSILGNTQSTEDTAISASPEEPTVMPTECAPSERQFQDDLDKILQNEGPSNDSSSV